MNPTPVTPAVCGIESCGIQAVGRCATCKRAFCLTHQGYYYNSLFERLSYVDMCVLCSEAKRAEEAKREAEAHAPWEYFKTGAARAALLAARVPTVEIYRVEKRKETKKKGFFGGSYVEEVEVVVPFARGWILGEFKWWYQTGTGMYGSITSATKNHLTALFDVDSNEPRLGSHLIYNTTLARVQPFSGGYKYSDYGGSDYFGGKPNDYRGLHWREAMQSVRQLAGLPTP